MTDLNEFRRIVKLPRLTERSTADQEKNNAYHFVVSRDANKIQIRQAVEKLFGVKVLSVNTVTKTGKMRRRITRRRQELWREQSWKKAIVKLKPGDSINFQ